MPHLRPSPDELLTTTRSVRKRLDLTRPVEPELVRECLEIAVQAPTGGNSQNWHFLVVTDNKQRQLLGELYQKGWARYRELSCSGMLTLSSDAVPPNQVMTYTRVRTSAQYLIDHICEVPVLIIPCVADRVDRMPVVEQAGAWGSILPATWSLMLAARERGLGTCWTTLHLYYKHEAAEVLGIPYEQVMQVALIPLAYTVGTAFKPAPRNSLDSVLHWDRW